MKKIIYTFILIVILFTTTAQAYALTSVSLTPVDVNVDEGDRFEINISIDPAGISNYTIKIALQFPSNLLQIESFSFNENWMPLNQPGYALIDNNKGVLLRTGGYPGGISSKTVFGIVTFIAKKSGSGTIKVNGGSLILNAQNKNVIDTSPIQVSVTIIPLIPLTIPDEIPPGYLFMEDMNRGDKSINVAHLQLCLKIAGVFEEEVNGYFGPATQKAVADFQEGADTVDSAVRGKLNALCTASLDVIPEQLFDINFEIDDATITDIKDLVARVVFVSFGREPTPMDLTFTIVNEEREEVYREKDYITIETERFLTKRFEEIELPSGKYSIVLQTLYNTDVYDEFRSNFEIVKPRLIPFWFWFIFAVIGLILFLLLNNRGLKMKKIITNK